MGLIKKLICFSHHEHTCLTSPQKHQVYNTLNPKRSHKAAWWEKENGRVGKVTCVGQVSKNIGLPGDAVVKNPPANAGDVGLIPGSGIFPGVGNGNLFQYSYLENSMGRGAWWAAVLWVTKELDTA